MEWRRLKWMESARSHLPSTPLLTPTIQQADPILLCPRKHANSFRAIPRQGRNCSWNGDRAFLAVEMHPQGA